MTGPPYFPNVSQQIEQRGVACPFICLEGSSTYTQEQVLLPVSMQTCHPERQPKQNRNTSRRRQECHTASLKVCPVNCAATSASRTRESLFIICNEDTLECRRGLRVGSNDARDSISRANLLHISPSEDMPMVQREPDASYKNPGHSCLMPSLSHHGCSRCSSMLGRTILICAESHMRPPHLPEMELRAAEASAILSESAACFSSELACNSASDCTAYHGVQGQKAFPIVQQLCYERTRVSSISCKLLGLQ